jgi:hypothetical protein
MWAGKQVKIRLLSLPPRSTYLLQPLDLSVFSVVKLKYRNQIRDLASLDDAAPIKKERFISYYHQAREEGFSPRVIRAGWKAAGLVPFDPNKVVHLSQVSGRPATPPQLPQQLDTMSTIYRTPRRP